MIYLAQPYSDKDPVITDFRYRAGVEALYHLNKQGLVVYAPIVIGHLIAEICDGSTEWEDWAKIDKQAIDVCDAIYVLQLWGWEDSVGVTEELRYVHSLRKKGRFYRVMGMCPLTHNVSRHLMSDWHKQFEEE